MRNAKREGLGCKNYSRRNSVATEKFPGRIESSDHSEFLEGISDTYQSRRKKNP